MLGENIKVLRKQKGLSQETLAQSLNVVRQTISKWEKGISVPDAEMLNLLAELFEVPVSTLLGSTIQETEASADSDMKAVAQQLALLNEQLASQAARKRRIWKKVIRWIVWGIVIFFGVLTIVWISGMMLFSVSTQKNMTFTTTEIECTLDGETYTYSIVYDQNFRIHESGGDGFINDHIDVLQYDDAGVLLAHIQDYFEDHGGTFRIVEERNRGTEE